MTPKQRKSKNAAERERRRLHRLHRYEYAARERGFRLLGGIDEVGRGPLAGPVVAACVVAHEPMLLKGLNDSKQVRPDVRRELAEQIRACATGWALGVASVEEIDRINIYWASVLAMERAIAALQCGPPDYLFTDAVRIRSYSGPQEPLIKGDELCAVISAASIIAKVHRDGLLEELDREDPRYGFAVHKGYATPQHISALQEYGPSVHHRSGFAPVKFAQLELLFEVGHDADELGETEYELQGARG
ncbi:MAG: ribonuclease HII [Candidatus Baltobacteraceae bacterium]